MRDITSLTPLHFTSLPLTGEYVRPILAKISRRKSYTSVVVATVERGLRTLTFCSMAMAGGTPSMESTSGLFILPRNWRAYDERLSANLLWPSANRVSNASEDLPEPEIPVITTSFPRGISTEMFFRLFTLAPVIEIFPLVSILDLASILANLIGMQRYEKDFA